MTSDDDKAARGDQTNIDTGGGPAFTDNQIETSPMITGGTFNTPVITAETVNYFHPPATPLDRQQQRNRQALLNQVENFWIKSVLKQSLYQIARLDLGLQHSPNHIHHPWETILQRAAIHQIIPAGTPVINLFNSLNGKMLILGAPGSGKTTLMLELTRDLIAHARDDEYHPIPLVFNLSTWASKQQPLTKWLVDELNQRYDVPRKLAQSWVEADHILPLLDGLDEVDAAHREACIVAINVYRQQHNFVPLVVCSRVADYAALTTKLRLQGAIIIQPLTRRTVEAYLQRVENPLAGVRIALSNDPLLWDLIDSPLLLSIVSLAYKDVSPATLRLSGTLEARRAQIFDDYIVAMFERPGRSKGAAAYPQAHLRRQLSWLARQMVQHNQTVFYIERMQPDWLRQQQQRYNTYVRLVSGLFGGLMGGLFLGLLVGLFGGLIGGLFCGLLFALIGKPIRRDEHIEIIEALHWSWSRRSLPVGLILVLLFGLVGGLSGGLPFGLLAGLVGGLLAGLVGGLASAEVEMKVAPNQGIHRSARSWLLIGLLIGLLFGLLGSVAGAPVVGLGFGWIDTLVGGLVGGLLTGLLLGLLAGLLLGLEYGGYAVFQHYTLRLLLYRNGSLPLRLVPFLDYCAERIFLRKVGGGYIFVHRLLMEHFASLYDEDGKVTR